MLQTAQSPKPPKASTGSTTLNGKAQAQAIAQAIAKQVAAEPVEILKNATEQVLGGAPKEEGQSTQRSAQGEALQKSEPDVQAQQRKHARHIQAFREELQEIKKLQQQRTQEFRQTKARNEQEQATQQAKQSDAPVEAQGKQKKGGMMQGVKKKVTNMLESFRNKKSRGIETQKMPSN